MSCLRATIAALAVFFVPAASAIGASATGHASVVLLSASTAAEISPLSFSLGAPAAGGSVVLSPTGNIRGNTMQSGIEGRPSIFTIGGEPFASVSISFTEGGAITGPGSALSVHDFAHSAGPTTMLDRFGNLTFAVGATLAIGLSQPPGRYTGTYAVTVNY